MKKGQMMSQPFVYMFALILGGLILVWGGKMIYDLVGTSNEAEIGTFYNDMKTEVNEYYNYEDGAARAVKIRLPKDIKYFCVFDPEKDLDCKTRNKIEDDPKSVNCNDLDTDFDRRLDTEKRKGANGKNVFVLPTSFTKYYSYKIPYLKPVGGNPICIPNGQDLFITSRVSYVAAE